MATTTENLYADLTAQGLEVLLDDRNESPGVKFNDADLLGMPVRLTVSRRTLKSASAEVKLRSQQKADLVPLKDVSQTLRILTKIEFSRLS